MTEQQELRTVEKDSWGQLGGMRAQGTRPADSESAPRRGPAAAKLPGQQCLVSSSQSPSCSAPEPKCSSLVPTLYRHVGWRWPRCPAQPAVCHSPSAALFSPLLNSAEQKHARKTHFCHHTWGLYLLSLCGATASCLLQQTPALSRVFLVWPWYFRGSRQAKAAEEQREHRSLVPAAKWNKTGEIKRHQKSEQFEMCPWELLSCPSTTSSPSGCAEDWL